MKPAFFTIGVYGSSEKEFFDKLEAAGVDTFCDIRLRRAVRGYTYPFANSNRLQERLEKMGIRYLHEKGLTPTKQIIHMQDEADKETHTARRQRDTLSDAFKKAFDKQILTAFDFDAFMKRLQDMSAKKVVLFCVEKTPSACHRGLVTDKLKSLYPGVSVKHL